MIGWLLCLPSLLVIGLGFLWPAAILLRMSLNRTDDIGAMQPDLTIATYARLLDDDMMPGLAGDTILLAAGCAAMAVTLAFPVALAIRAAPPRWRGPLALAAELLATAPLAAGWPEEWIAGLRRSGVLTGRADSERVVTDAVTVLLALVGERSGPSSRVELGARLLGDAHALDRDRLLHAVVLRGLAAAAGEAAPGGAREQERLWASYGVAPDLLSRTCLTWGLRPAGNGVAERLRLAADAGDPMHLTAWDLRRLDVLELPAGTRVLVLRAAARPTPRACHS